MSEKKKKMFDYKGVAEIYKKMQKITGDTSDSDSIAGILYNADKEYHENVDVCEEAVFGDLGKQLLLDWENTSSNFGSFVSNFNNWSTLIAQSAGDYSQFEQAVAGFKEANPLGATSGGITDAYTNTGYYSNSLSSDELNNYSDELQLYELTGAKYVDTGMVEYAKTQKVFNRIDDALTVASLVFATVSAVKYVGKAASLLKTGASTAGVTGNIAGLRGGMSQAGNRTAQAVGSKISGSGFASRLALTGIGSKIASGAIKGGYQVGKMSFFLTHVGAYGGAGKAVLSQAGKAALKSGIATASVNGAKIVNGQLKKIPDMEITTGTGVEIDDKAYSYVGHSGSGTDLYSDKDGNIMFMGNNNKLTNVTVENNGKKENATLDNIESDSKIFAGKENMGTFDNLYTTKGVVDGEELKNYSKNISTNMQTIIDSHTNVESETNDNNVYENKNENSDQSNDDIESMQYDNNLSESD